MKSFAPKISLALAVIFLFTHPITTSGAEIPPPSEPVVFSAEAVREDLAFLYETLEVSTYDLVINPERLNTNSRADPGFGALLLSGF